MTAKNEKLSNGTILGYGAASIGDAGMYNFVLMYMIFFMTNVAGLDPVTAGGIYSIAVIFEAIITLFVEPITDNTRSRFGRRRPYILAGAIAMSLSSVLLFTAVDFGETGNYVYYLVACVVFFVSYMLWMTPYTALGSELTLDYDERTKLRTPATIFQNIGNIAGMSLPMAAVAFFASAGFSDAGAWRLFTIILTAVCLVSILITWRVTRGKELPADEVFTENTDRNPVKSYLRILRLKPFWWAVGYSVLFYVGYTVYQSGLTYYVLYCAGMSEAMMSTAMMINIFIGIVMAIIISKFAQFTDKRICMAVCFLAAAAGMIAFNFIGVSSMAGLVILMFFFNIGNGAFWLLAYPIQYDMAEAYDYKFGGRKEASIYTLMAMLVSLSSSLGAQVLTRGLAATGYDPSLEEQSADVINGISMTVLGIPAAAFVLAAVCCFLFPITKKKYAILIEQKANKEAGRNVDESQLKRII